MDLTNEIDRAGLEAGGRVALAQLRLAVSAMATVREQAGEQMSWAELALALTYPATLRDEDIALVKKQAPEFFKKLAAAFAMSAATPQGSG